jgi:superfamily II DNA or RNA helicase
MTSISNRGYGLSKSQLRDAELHSLRKELTVSPFCFDKNGPPPPKFPVFKESQKKIYLPKFFGLQRYGLAQEDKSNQGTDIDLEFKSELRPNQAAPVKAFLDACHDPLKRGGIISLGCGGGKTIMALHCIAQLKKKTLVVVHKSFLLDQWLERIAEFLPGASVGMIKAQTIDSDNRDIVIGSLQSLSMKEYDSDLFNDIGLLIVDEVHRIGTEVFSRALLKVCPKYSMGLSATVKRKDGLSKVFTAWLGDVVYAKKRDKESVEVRMMNYYSEDPEYSEELYVGRTDKLNTAAMMTKICSHDPRTELIVNTIRDVVRAENGRKILVLCDRKNLLREMHYRLSCLRIDCGFYHGGLKQEVLDESAKRQVILATCAFAQEGLDIPALNTLIFTSPKTEIEQCVGRILRLEAHKRELVPLVIDFVDNFSVFKVQAGKRRKFYKKNKYDVIEIDGEGSSSLEEDSKQDVIDFSRCLIED